MKIVDILDVLLDEENTDNIFMGNDIEGMLEFSQVAVIPYENDLYCILKPVSKIEGIKDDEAVVFKVIEEDDRRHYLSVVSDEERAVTIFIEYYKLFEKSLGDSK